MSALCRTIQEAGHARLASVSELSGIPLLLRLRNDVASEIEAAVAQIGICIFVFPALPTEINRELAAVEGDWELRLRVIENPAINTTGLPNSYEVTEYILAALHHHSPRLDAQAFNPFVATARPVTEIEDSERVIFDITFTLSAGIQLRAGEAATPIT